MRVLAPLLVLLSLLLVQPLPAHDDIHDFDDWYSSLKQPDNPDYSCCGIADAYWCDDVYTRKGATYCKITDDRDDTTLKNRTHVPLGTEIEIPEKKLKWDRGNPTGHAILFMSSGGSVLCFVQSSGT